MSSSGEELPTREFPDLPAQGARSDSDPA